jgi:hypothetical protein
MTSERPRRAITTRRLWIQIVQHGAAYDAR